MSFIGCILGQVKQGFLTEAQARDLNDMYETLVERYSRTMGSDAAAHMAAEHFVNVQQKIIMKRTEAELSHALALTRVRKELDGMASTIQQEKETASWGKFLHGDPYARAVRMKLERVYERQMSLEREAVISIADVIEKFRSKNAGLKQDVEGFKNVVREVLGQDTGSKAAKVFGQAVSDTFTRLRDLYDESGGIMGKIERYFPSMHEQELVSRSTFEEWRDYLLPRLDREKIIDLDTGMPMSDKRLNEAMKEAYESIKTNGLVDVAEKAADGKQMMRRGGGEINTRHKHSRFFHFKDADSFLEYNTRYGRGDAGLFDAMMGHIHSMTRDIALMQGFGAKPTALMRNINLEMEGRGLGINQQKVVNGMYDVLAGKLGYGGTLSPAYKFTMGWLNIKRSAYLGSAPISAISDTFFLSYTSKMAGLSAVKTMGNYFKLLNPASDRDRQIARRLFHVASAASGMGIQGARFADDVGRGGITAWLAGFTNRASGLAAMTDAGRHATMMTLAGELGDLHKAKTPFDQWDGTLRQMAEIYDITAKDWDTMLKAERTIIGDIGDEFLLPENVLALGTGDAADTARKFGDLMVGLGQKAVNEPRLLTRAITSGAVAFDARQGSIGRLIAANVFFAKSFPITVMINALLPAMRSATHGRFGNLATMLIGSTIMGAVAIQARQFLQGKTEQDMNTPKFWMASMLQGGGMGLFGDFMFADYNRFGQSIGGTVAGPIVGSAQSMLRAGDLYGLAEGDWDARDFAADTWRVASKEIPAVRLWYTRLFVERAILDQVEKTIDPRYHDRINRLERRMQKQYGQDFWWRPGDVTPDGG